MFVIILLFDSSYSGDFAAGTRRTRRSSPRGEPPPATTPRRAVQSRCRRTPGWPRQRRRKATSRRPILSRRGFASHFAPASMQHPAKITRPRRRALRSRRRVCRTANRAATPRMARADTGAPNRLPVQLPRSRFAEFS